METKAQSILLKAITPFVVTGLVVLSSCGFEFDPMDQGVVSVKITDAPADNPDVQAVYATIVGVKVDGRNLQEFEGPKTINIMALQNGATELLASGTVLAQIYKTVTLELDFQKDDKGEAPGVYYISQNGAKVGLASGNQKRAGYTWTGVTRIYSEDTASVVLDFDLRKFIKKDDDGKAALAANHELGSYLRFVDEKSSGTITGNYIGSIEAGKHVVAYAYKRGTFNAYIEKTGKGGIQFLNAISSVSLSGSAANTYFFPYLEEGEYELHFASFANEGSDVVFEGLINVKNEIEGEPLNTIKIYAGTQANINVLANGLLN